MGFLLAGAVAALAVGVSWRRWGRGEVQEVYRPDPRVVELERELERVLHFSQGQVEKAQAQLEEALESEKRAWAQSENVAAQVERRYIAEVRTLKTRVDYLYQQVSEKGLELDIARQREESLNMQIATQERFIAHELNVPAYAISTRQTAEERAASARRLFLEEQWSRRQIQRKLYGYVGGTACKRVQQALADAVTMGVTGTAIVRYQDRYHGLEWVLPGALFGV